MRLRSGKEEARTGKGPWKLPDIEKAKWTEEKQS